MDLAADTVTFATAGHPPPLLLLPDGHLRQLATANSPMIGISPRRGVADSAPFPRGAQLVMFTDAPIERHDRPFEVGLSEAAQHLATLRQQLSPDDLIDSLLDTLVGDTQAADDIAIAVIEHTA
jgi:serine phosphatase RsbU (regulator of sigma subunit)